MPKICKKCGRKIGFGEYTYKGECENCNKGISYTTTQNSYKKPIDTNNILAKIITAIVICIFVIPIIMMFVGAKNDSESRKQRELREFNTQMKQDPSTWNKEQRDRYDSFTEWDWKN